MFEEPVGLGEENVGLQLRALVGVWYGVEVIRDEIQRDAGLVVLRVQEVLEERGRWPGNASETPTNFVVGSTARMAVTIAS